MTVRLLLDTCAFLDLAQGRLHESLARSSVKAAVDIRQSFVPSVVALELAQKVWAGKLRLWPSAESLFAYVVDAFGLRLTPLDADLAFAAYSLPEPFHRDPMDRLIVATARALNIPVVTSDRHILAYAAAGHVEALGYRSIPGA